MTARATYRAMASIADDGMVIDGLRDELREALDELDRLRQENEQMLVAREMRNA